MIFREIILHNFGVYKGRHHIVLNDAKDAKYRRPIILFGALNGSGKTTLLDALQLVLYGKNATQSNRRNLSYSDYLQSVVNRDTSLREGAAIELTIGLSGAEGEQELRVARYWRQNGQAMVEKIEVFRDGQHDAFSSEQWDEVVDEILPKGITHLFFFDGEKIEHMADLRNAAATIETGINTLLGLDLVDQLETDLTIVSRRKKKQILDDVDQALVEHIENELKELKAASESKCQEVAAIQNQISHLENEKAKLQTRYEKVGGTLLEQREELKEQRAILEKEKEHIINQLYNLAAGPAPLILVRPLLSRVLGQLDQEKKQKWNQEIVDILVQRDQQFLKHLKTSGHDKSIVDSCKQFLSADRKARAKSAKSIDVLAISETSFPRIPDRELQEIVDSIQSLAVMEDKLDNSLYSLEKKLSAVPTDEGVSSISTELARLDFELDKKRELLQVSKTAYSEVIEAISKKQTDLDRMLEKKLLTRLTNQKQARISNHIDKVQSTLKTFRKVAAEKHLIALQDMILESFQELHRKGNFVQSVHIDPDEFTLTLTDSSGHEFDPNKLSAGERQLLAVSILWALSKASGRPLPLIIDTPLGRLDTKHRDNLVKHYFPKASHQVILLSTDTEIGSQYYRQLKPAISKAYQINYDSSTSSSTVLPGYFE